MELGHKTASTVSVVIPTRGRPRLVERAVRSALAQTLDPAEILVIVDGPDAASVEALGRISDPRLRIVTLEESVGPANARNAGVEASGGRWVAFLDDDDEWLPRKLEVQLAAANRSRHPRPIVISRFVARTSRGEAVWPRRVPAPSEPLSEYLMVRRGLFLGETWIGTPMILARTELLREVPFKNGMQVHEDWDWVLRASRVEGVGIEFVSEALTVCRIHADPSSASVTHGWRSSLAWIRASRDLVTPRAYAGFIATVVSPAAARQGAWASFLPLLREMLNPGRPKPIDLLLFAGMWLVPHGVRRQLRPLLVKKRGT